MERRKTREVSVGNIKIGNNNPITIQSMLNTKTVDIEGSVKQIEKLKQAGCDLIRLACPDEDSCIAFGEIVKKTNLPLIADIHYSYKLAHLAIQNGAKKIRMNPGNMEDFNQIESLAKELIDKNIPIRIGVNAGSLSKKYKGMDIVDALVESSLECANVFERYKMSNIILAIKDSDTMINIEANRKISKICDYPLHIGVTESGTLNTGLIKSSIGIGTLLQEGIGDTIRVSLSTDVVEEVQAAKKILNILKIRNNMVNVIACPTCSRTEIDVETIAKKVEEICFNINKPLTISVLGCPLNGIGEGENSGLGIAGGKDYSIILKNGKIFKKVNSAQLFEEFNKLLKELL